MTSSDEDWKTKCKLLKKKILQVEENNKVASVAVTRSRVAVNRLRLEYAILLERLEKKTTLPESDEDDFDDEEIELVERKETKKKKANPSQPRDPDMPKRPVNPYLVFCDMKKDDLKREAEAEGRPVDLAKTLGDLWRSMDDKAKQPYVDSYHAAKEQYNVKMKEYEDGLNKKKLSEEAGTESPAPEK